MSQGTENPGTGGERNQHSTSSLIHRTDLRLAAVILAICAVLYYVTTTFEEVPQLLSQSIGPEWFPQLLIWTIVALTLILPFEHLFLKQGSDGLDADRRERIRPMTAVTACLLILLVGTIVLFGTAIAMVLVCIALPVLWGERRLRILVPYVILFPLAVGFLFTRVLKVYFDPGLLGPEI